MEQKTVKIEIGKVLAVVITVVAIAAATSIFLSSNYYKGLIGYKTVSLTTDSNLVSTETTPDKIDLTDTKLTEPLSTSELEEQPIKIVTDTDKDFTVATPPEISFAYLDRVDPSSPSIYGNQLRDHEQVLLIFRLRNTGSLSAYLKGFNTFSSYSKDGCSSSNLTCHLLLSRTGTLVRFNYDSSGNMIDWDVIGSDLDPDPQNVSTQADGYFQYPELTNHTPLEIKGNSDAIFGVINDTSYYGATSQADVTYTVEGRAFIETPTLDVVNINGAPVGNIVTAQDSITPQTIYFN